MSIANNHTGDFGARGRQVTKETLDQARILHSGPIGDVASWEVKGLKVALIAFASAAELHRVQDIELAKKRVAALKAEHDLVIVSFHAGAEGAAAAHVPNRTEMFHGEDRGNVRVFAHAMVDAGADLLLGHGPHVLRGVERYRGRLIAYSLGNFAAWDSFNLKGPQGVSVVLKVELAPNDVLKAASLVPVVIDRPGIPRPDPEQQGIRIIRELSQADFGSSVFDAQGFCAQEPVRAGWSWPGGLHERVN